jgi:hypothetical protein
MRLSLLLASLLFSSFAFAQSSDDKLATDRAHELLLLIGGKQCQAARDFLGVAKDDQSKELAALVHTASCECFPTELQKGLAPYKSVGSISTREAVEVATLATDACNAQQMKSRAENLCLLDKDKLSAVQDHAAHCKCYAQHVRSLNDQQISEASKAAYAGYRAQVRSRQAGESVQKAQPTILDSISEQCRRGPTQ